MGVVLGTAVTGGGSWYPLVVEMGFVDLDLENIHGLIISYHLV